jgi:hypothetical protein
MQPVLPTHTKALPYAELSLAVGVTWAPRLVGCRGFSGRRFMSITPKPILP